MTPVVLSPSRTLRPWIVLAWLALPGVMVGGGLLLGRLTLGNPTPFQLTWIRAFHAHGGVLLLMSLLYCVFLDRTTLPAGAKHAGCAGLFGGIAAIVGGFLMHALIGQPNHSSIGTLLTLAGAVTTAAALVLLLYGLIAAPAEAGDQAESIRA